MTGFVSVEISRRCKLLVAYIARVAFFPRVHKHMRLQVFASTKPLLANFARKFIDFLDVTLLVIFQISFTAVKLTTNLAAIGLFSGVQRLVIQHVLFDLELFVTDGTVVECFDCSASVSAE